MHNAISAYWMAGLAPHAVNFFKFLLVLVLYTTVMTLFVSNPPSHKFLLNMCALGRISSSEYLYPTAVSRSSWAR